MRGEWLRGEDGGRERGGLGPSARSPGLCPAPSHSVRGHVMSTSCPLSCVIPAWSSVGCGPALACRLLQRSPAVFPTCRPSARPVVFLLMSNPRLPLPPESPATSVALGLAPGRSWLCMAACASLSEIRGRTSSSPRPGPWCIVWKWGGCLRDVARAHCSDLIVACHVSWEQSLDRAGLQNERHADGQVGAGVPARHRAV